MQGHKSPETNVLSDYCDGERCKTHSLFSVSSNLQILFYYDDVEPCNTLGSGRAKHKLGELSFTLKNMYCSLSFVPCSQCTVHVHVSFTVSAAVFYFMLGNVKPKFRSKLNNIQLVALSYHKHIKKYSLDDVVAPILRDLKKLVSTCTLVCTVLHSLYCS